MKNVEERLTELKRSKRFREDAARIREEIARSKHKFLTLEKDRDEEVSAKEVSRMLEDGSLNREGVLIHDDHDWFAERYALELYVDPDHDHPVGFDPFQSPALLINHFSGDDTMTVRIDVKAPIKKVGKELGSIKRKIVGYRKRGHEKYSGDELRRARNLVRKGLEPLEIFHRMNDGFAWFHPGRDYNRKSSRRKDDFEGSDKDYRTMDDFRAYDAYQRCLRLIGEVKRSLR